MPRFRRRDVLLLVPLTTPPSPSPRPPLAAVARPTTHAVHITFTFTFARLVGTVNDRVPDVASLVQQSLAEGQDMHSEDSGANGFELPGAAPSANTVFKDRGLRHDHRSNAHIQQRPRECPGTEAKADREQDRGVQGGRATAHQPLVVPAFESSG